MTREWINAQGLAGLPAMPSSVQGVNYRARRDSWQSRRRKGRGGGREYAVRSLPVETQIAIKADLIHPQGKLPRPARTRSGRVVSRRDLRVIAALLDCVGYQKKSLAASLQALSKSLRAASGEEQSNGE